MTRLCDTCRQHHPLRDFDLGGGQLSATCVTCAHERLRTEDQQARSRRNERIATLERRRREMIAALMKIDGEIADLRVHSRPTPTRIVLEAPSPDDSTFDDFGDHTRDEMS